MAKIIWYHRDLNQNGGGEQFCLSVVKNSSDKSIVITKSYNAEIFPKQDKSIIRQVADSKYYILFIWRLRRILKKEAASGAVIQTSGTWNHVIDVWLATLFSKLEYDCWLWGSMFQFDSAVEKLKYCGIFRRKIDDILNLNPTHRQIFCDYTFINAREWIRCNLISILKYLSVRGAKRIFVLSELNRLETQILFKRDAVVDFALFEAPPRVQFNSPNTAEEGVRVFTVGRIAKNKNIDQLLLAFREIAAADPSAHFDIIGTGSERGEMERLAQFLKIDRQVTFHGFLEEDKIHQLIKSDAIFWCYDNADFNLAPFQFAAAGYRVLCAEPFQENFLTKSLANFHICAREIQTFVETTRQIVPKPRMALDYNIFDFYKWSSLSKRLSKTK